MEDIQDLYASFRDAERVWMETLSTTVSPSMSSNSCHISVQDCSLHYGELAFVLAGLKPCVLIQLPTPALTQKLFQEVIEAQWMQRESFKRQKKQAQEQEREREHGQELEPAQGREEDQGTASSALSSSLGLECRRITINVCSPEMPLYGCVLVWSNKTVHSHPESSIIRRGIDLLFNTSFSQGLGGDMLDETQRGDDGAHVISDQDLAIMLDIPGDLPQTPAELWGLVEVSYWDLPILDTNTSNNSNTKTTANADNSDGQNIQRSQRVLDPNAEPVLTTIFMAQSRQTQGFVQDHFRRYKEAVRALFHMELRLSIRPMDGNI